MRMRLRTKVVLAHQGRAPRPSTHCTCYAKKDRVLHWDLSDQNADTKEIERFAVDAATQMSVGDTLIWDRLGRSGRALHPTHQHYSPAVREEFKERGVSMKFLPPKGKYCNPIELLFNDLKSHHIRPNFPQNGQNLSKSKLFDHTWMRGRQVRYLVSSVPVRTAKRQLQIKSCNFVPYTRRCKPYVSIARGAMYMYVCVHTFF